MCSFLNAALDVLKAQRSAPVQDAGESLLEAIKAQCRDLNETFLRFQSNLTESAARQPEQDIKFISTDEAVVRNPFCAACPPVLCFRSTHCCNPVQW